jgi:hypothetical protein
VATRDESSIPKEFALLGNYPNPFNPATTIRYTMPEPGAVTLKVFDVLGRNVALVPLGLQQTGKREVVFNPRNLSSGVYLYRLEMVSAATKQTKSTLYGKMMLLQ